MYWINIDKPEKSYTLHENSCTYIPQTDTQYKGINSFLRDGGWFSFSSLDEVQNYCVIEYNDYIFKTHHCIKKKK